MLTEWGLGISKLGAKTDLYITLLAPTAALLCELSRAHTQNSTWTNGDKSWKLERTLAEGLVVKCSDIVNEVQLEPQKSGGHFIMPIAIWCSALSALFLIHGSKSVKDGRLKEELEKKLCYPHMYPYNVMHTHNVVYLKYSLQHKHLYVGYSAATMTISSMKKAMRKQTADVLKSLQRSAVSAQSAAVLAQLATVPAYTRARSASVYLPMDGSSEVDTWPILAALLSRGVTVAVPRVAGPKPGDMRMLRVSSYEEAAALPRTKWGIPEPDEAQAARMEDMTGAAFDLLLVPGVAFDALRGKLREQGWSRRWLRPSHYASPHASAWLRRTLWHPSRVETMDELDGPDEKSNASATSRSRDRQAISRRSAETVQLTAELVWRLLDYSQSAELTRVTNTSSPGVLWIDLTLCAAPVAVALVVALRDGLAKVDLAGPPLPASPSPALPRRVDHLLGDNYPHSNPADSRDEVPESSASAQFWQPQTRRRPKPDPGK